MYSLINRLFSPAREFLNPVSKLMIASFFGGGFLGDSDSEESA